MKEKMEEIIIQAWIYGIVILSNSKFIELSSVSEFGESIDPTIVDFNFKE